MLRSPYESGALFARVRTAYPHLSIVPGTACMLRRAATEDSTVKITPLILLLGACAPLAVTTHYDRSYDFSHASTFSFAANPRRNAPDPASQSDNNIDNSIVRHNLREAIIENLAQKGIAYQKEGGQVLVSYYVNAAQKERQVATYPNYGWDYGYGMDYGYGYGYGAGWQYGYDFSPLSNEPFLDTQYYQEGTVIIDVVDPANKHLVWRGKGVREISATADETALKIRRTTAKILRTFPPR
jgi:hypothetical protein